MRAGIPLAGAALVLLVGVSAAAPPSETRYVAQLRQAAAQVESALREVSGVDRQDAAALQAVGGHLSSASGAACQALRTYQRATTRYGTDEEYALVQKLSGELVRARSAFGVAANVTLAAPSASQRSAAEQMLRDLATSAASRRIATWIGDQRLADILTAGDLKEIRVGLERELARRIDAEARSLSQRALGLSLSLGSPLRGQVESQAEQAALRWLSKTVLRWDATGLAIQLVGVPVVRFLRDQLKQAFRDHKHVTERVDRTVKGFDARIAELEKLIGSAESAPLASVRRLLSRAQRALDATLYLKSDLSKQGRGDLLARLAQAEARLRAKMSETRQAFLLDSQLARSNVTRMADDVCKLQGEIVKITKRLGSGSRPAGDRIVGDWTAAGGVMRVTAAGSGAYEGRLVKTYSFCRSGSVPLGQVEWKMTRVATNKYKGTVRYYRVSDCTYIGDAKNATWEYRPADDTLYACSWSPDPALPGGGCSVSQRVKR